MGQETFGPQLAGSRPARISQPVRNPAAAGGGKNYRDAVDPTPPPRGAEAAPPPRPARCRRCAPNRPGPRPRTDGAGRSGRTVPLPDAHAADNATSPQRVSWTRTMSAASRWAGLPGSDSDKPREYIQSHDRLAAQGGLGYGPGRPNRSSGLTEASCAKRIGPGLGGPVWGRTLMCRLEEFGQQGLVATTVRVIPARPATGLSGVGPFSVAQHEAAESPRPPRQSCTMGAQPALAARWAGLGRSPGTLAALARGCSLSLGGEARSGPAGAGTPITISRPAGRGAAAHPHGTHRGRNRGPLPPCCDGLAWRVTPRHPNQFDTDPAGGAVRRIGPGAAGPMTRTPT